MIRVAYALGDVAVLLLGARLIVGSRVRNTSLYLLTGAAAGWFAGDVANSLLAGELGPTTYWGGRLYCLSYVLFGAAALHPSMPSLATPGEAPATRLSVRRLALLAPASLLAPALLVAQDRLGAARVDATTIGVACAVLFLLVVARMASLIRRVEEQSEQPRTWPLATGSPGSATATPGTPPCPPPWSRPGAPGGR